MVTWKTELRIRCCRKLLRAAGGHVSGYELMYRLQGKTGTKYERATLSHEWCRFRRELVAMKLIERVGTRFYRAIDIPGLKAVLATLKDEMEEDLENDFDERGTPENKATADVERSVMNLGKAVKSVDELFEEIAMLKRLAGSHLNRILELEETLNDPTRRLVNKAMADKILEQRKEIAELIDETRPLRELITAQKARIHELEVENAKLWHDIDAMSDPAHKIPPEDKKLLDDLGVDLNGQEAA
jgi:hypothetical protein